MRTAVATAVLGAALLSPASSGAQTGLDDPALRGMAATVLANPVEVRRYVALARTRPEKVGAPILLLAGQYELGRGRFAAAERFFGAALAAGGEGPWRGPAESGLGWAALGRGDLAAARRHYTASARTDATTTIVAALLAAAEGDASAAAELAGLASTAVGELADVARLALGYASLWTGAAAEAEAAFATVASPALLDDATYARARLQHRRGDVDEARTTLATLAEVAPEGATERPSRALLDLSPGAVLRAGLRRTRGRAILSEREQLAVVLDGDGATLARAAMQRLDGAAPRAALPPLAAAERGAETRPARPARDRAAERPGHEPRDGADGQASHGAVHLAALLALVACTTWWLRRRRLEPGMRRS